MLWLKAGGVWCLNGLIIYKLKVIMLKLKCLKYVCGRHIAHEVRNVVRRTHRPPLPRKYSWYSFLLEAWSTPGSQWGRNDYINKKFQ